MTAARFPFAGRPGRPPGHCFHHGGRRDTRMLDGYVARANRRGAEASSPVHTTGRAGWPGWGPPANCEWPSHDGLPLGVLRSTVTRAGEPEGRANTPTG